MSLFGGGRMVHSIVLVEPDLGLSLFVESNHPRVDIKWSIGSMKLVKASKSIVENSCLLLPV